MEKKRLRFAPSPTGYLHIGGLRTALYNYFLAKKSGGIFLLRIEDTDQSRYVEGAEEYINQSLAWAGIRIDEGVNEGGEYGPYRQSQRSEMYKKFADILVKNGCAYYAFDTEVELEALRERLKTKGIHSPKYDASTRLEMKNSLTLSESEVQVRMQKGEDYVVRLKIPQDETLRFKDEVRGVVTFESSELDDKVLLKADGLPTYHLANVVDDYHMKITDVVRGEEWLSSTAHHVLLYRSFGWLKQMPRFAHLPLILKPSGKGKLSKRDGAKLGIPVFPLGFEENGEEVKGFREYGFHPQAMNNFLAFLGWNPGTEQEVFSMEELIEAFDLSGVSKAGARFDYDKALWFNQQYILHENIDSLMEKVRLLFDKYAITVDEEFLRLYVSLMQERCHTYLDFLTLGDYMYGDIREWDRKQIKKRWKPESASILRAIIGQFEAVETWDIDSISQSIKSYIQENDLSFGAVLPLLRLATAGIMNGPDIFAMIQLIGKQSTINRLHLALEEFPRLN